MIVVSPIAYQPYISGHIWGDLMMTEWTSAIGLSLRDGTEEQRHDRPTEKWFQNMFCIYSADKWVPFYCGWPILQSSHNSKLLV